MFILLFKVPITVNRFVAVFIREFVVQIKTLHLYMCFNVCVFVQNLSQYILREYRVQKNTLLTVSRFCVQASFIHNEEEHK